MATEWDNQPPHAPLQHPNIFAGIHDNTAASSNVVSDALYVKVMTDEQLEVLRNQIAVYASICEQLVELHKSVTAQQDLAGARLGNFYCDPLVTAIGHKITARQRWTPTPVQLTILEQIFDKGVGTPSKQKIKEITTELSQHGHISETNVYNWFQNRRARSKRKQLNSASNNAESEVETDAESTGEKKTKPDDFQPEHDSAAVTEDYCYQGQDMSSEIHSIGPCSNEVGPLFSSDGRVKPSQSAGHLAFYNSVMEESRNAGIDQFIGKMEVPGNYNLYQPGEDYSM